MSGFKLHPKAYSDLDDIWEYIATDDLNAADRVREKIYEVISGLVLLPHKGHFRFDLANRPLRFIRVYDYLIAYAADEQPLWIVAVIHGRRSPRLLAAILRDRR